MSGKPIRKECDLLSPLYLEWIRKQSCFWGDENCGPTRAHHFPPKGRGIINDLATIPVCDVEHRRCHGETVVFNMSTGSHRLAPIAQELQHTAVLVTFWKFWDTAPTWIKRAVLDDIALRDSARVYVSF